MQEVTWDEISETAKLPEMEDFEAATEKRIRRGEPLKITNLPDGGSRTFESADDFKNWFESLRLAGHG